MKATEVCVRQALDVGESYVDPSFLLVETILGDTGEPVTRIDRIASERVAGHAQWQVITLGQDVPMSHGAALQWAISFAASREIPVVYERDYTVEPTYAAARNDLRLSSSSASK